MGIRRGHHNSCRSQRVFDLTLWQILRHLVDGIDLIQLSDDGNLSVLLVMLSLVDELRMIILNHCFRLLVLK